MKYKALILDVDGTLIPNKYNGIPSKNVKESIEKAQEKLHVGIATARPLSAAGRIIDMLNLSGPSIVNGGAQVIDGKSKKVLFDQPLDMPDILPICHILYRYSKKIHISDGEKDVQYSSRFIPQRPYQIFAEALDPVVAQEVVDTISEIPTVSAQLVNSWTPGKRDVVVNHVQATKLYGVYEVEKILKIHRVEIIGVGDGYNDFPLLMACGLKVAMGGAPQGLKDIADYVAPSVEEDGVVDIINKFVLKE